jgi:hypothetical protein
LDEIYPEHAEALLLAELEPVECLTLDKFGKEKHLVRYAQNKNVTTIGEPSL